jgi:hypothetical protein
MVRGSYSSLKEERFGKPWFSDKGWGSYSSLKEERFGKPWFSEKIELIIHKDLKV